MKTKPPDPAPAGEAPYKTEPAMELFQELCTPAHQMPEALKACHRLRYTAADLAAWRTCRAQAEVRAKADRRPLGDPLAFVRSRMLRYRHPKEAGIGWYREAEAPPDPREAERRKAAVAGLLRRRGQIARNAKGEEYEPARGGSGLYGPRGYQGWSRYPTALLVDLSTGAGFQWEEGGDGEGVDSGAKGPPGDPENGSSCGGPGGGLP